MYFGGTWPMFRYWFVARKGSCQVRLTRLEFVAMQFLAAALVLSTVLYLVDKNQVWPKFWRALRWGCGLLLLIVYSVVLNHVPFWSWTHLMLFAGFVTVAGLLDRSLRA